MFSQKSSLELTPEQFELEVKRFVEKLGSNLQSFEAKHLESVSGMDGDYEIDIVAKFIALDVAFTVLVECKRYKEPVKREVVQILKDKLNSTGAQKGMIFTTSGFQKGAIEYATKNGIALVQLVDERANYFARSEGFSLELPKIEKPPVAGWLIGVDEEGRTTMSFVSDKNSKKINDFFGIK